MATAVERPLPDTTNREIIDVDEFDFGHPPAQGRREQIYFVDSDGEEDLIEILSPRLQPSTINGSRPTRHYVPGGPRRNPSIPPPVPAIPARFSAHPTSFPRRRQAQSTGLPNLPPVIPSQEPLAFQIFGSSPERNPTTASPAAIAGPSISRSGPPQAAPPSHHTPSMGLGGALISSSRRESQQRQRAQLAMEIQRRNRALLLRAFGPEGDAGPSSGFGSGSSAGSSSSGGAASGSSRRRRWHSLANSMEDLFTGEDDDAPAHQHIHMLVNGAPPGGPGVWQATGMSWHTLAVGHMGMGAGAEARDKDQYQQRYTHPLRPEPGFTFDFDGGAQAEAPIVLDDDGVVVTPDVQVTSSLVCARCTEPLVLNAAMAEEEAALRRIWALRCGHMIDERCLNEIGQPPEQAAEDAPVKVDRKGKGKAKAAPSPSSPLNAEPAPAPPTHDPETGGIRSRLRSRITATASALYAMVDPSPAQLPTATEGPPPRKKRRVANRKPKVEGTFAWACPVASCRREHVSVRIDGVWGPEREVHVGAGGGGKKAAAAAPPHEPRGAVPVFA
ncbi:hypothetical protein D9619_005006 [Psilocybe cf. subviscida]|uniref:Uncharacterized protein n=1 Tax=Psilocybe cf. subviscida TaxID=2480587 RepID=A0A8H5BPX8_9AGAR|nr:hypothetical protein D9619_005006 [Psilocybe cf. subviscida]